jgi:hypothetical protein
MTACPASSAPADVTGFFGLYSRGASGLAKLKLRRDRWGPCYYVVDELFLDTFVPVVTRLAGD